MVASDTDSPRMTDEDKRTLHPATAAEIEETLSYGLIREYPNRVSCDRPVSGFPLLEEFVTPFG